MKANNLVFLVGMMGSGKTTVGKALAKRLGLDFADADEQVVSRSGVPIPTIFEIEGEAGFRRREHLVLQDLARRERTVVATGGGAVLDPDNRQLMHNAGTVVYLHVGVEHLHRRTARDTSRPLLANAPDRRATLESLLVARDSLYREAAHLVIEGGGGSATELARRLADMLAPPGKAAGRRA